MKKTRRGAGLNKKEKPRELRDWWLVELSLNFTWWCTTLVFLNLMFFLVLQLFKSHNRADGTCFDSNDEAADQVTLCGPPFCSARAR